MLLLKTTKNKILGSWRCGVQLLFLFTEIFVADFLKMVYNII